MHCVISVTSPPSAVLSFFQNFLFIFYALVPLLTLLNISSRGFKLPTKNSIGNMAANWEKITDEGNEGQEVQKK
jgi:hypothetical protein